VLAVGIIVLLFACSQVELMVSTEQIVTYPTTVYKVDINSAGYGISRLEGLVNSDVYLVRVTGSPIAYSTNTLSVDAPVEREQLVEGTRSPSGTITLPNGETLIVQERHWQVVVPDEGTSMLSQRSANSLAETQIDDTRLFYVDTSPTASAYEQKPAILKKIGEYCKIWVAEESFSNESIISINDGKVNQEQINNLAKKFDEIYPHETRILGYEYGGGPGGNGGVDGDPKIQILIFDIDKDFGIPRSNMTMGYFYPGDEYRRGSTYPYSNEAEIFYLDSEMVDSDPIAIYSTLIHEFNHMINFNIKVLVAGHIRAWNSEVWYTEMLSMLAEDTIGPLVGIQPNAKGHVTDQRIPQWLSNYTDTSVMYWPTAGNAVPYYASNYAFGAYLIRNFGGPALFSAIAKSYATGRGSIDACLRFFNGREIDTAYAMERFGEALVYSGDAVPSDIFSFDKSVRGDIDGTTYTFERFNIWKLSYNQGPVVRQYNRINDYSIPLNTVQLYIDEAWKGVNGRLDVLLQNVDTKSKYLLMVKQTE
jgi:hypothetical protein